MTARRSFQPQPDARPRCGSLRVRSRGGFPGKSAAGGTSANGSNPRGPSQRDTRPRGTDPSMLPGPTRGVGQGRGERSECIVEPRCDPTEGDSTVDRSAGSTARRLRPARPAPSSRRDSLGRNRWPAPPRPRDLGSRSCRSVLCSQPARAHLHVCGHVRGDPSGGPVGYRIPSLGHRGVDVPAAEVSRCGGSSCLRAGGCQRSSGRRHRGRPCAPHGARRGRGCVGHRVDSDPAIESASGLQGATLPVTPGELPSTRSNREETSRGRALPFGSNPSGLGSALVGASGTKRLEPRPTRTAWVGRSKL
jgi:hypothetical protein